MIRGVIKNKPIFGIRRSGLDRRRFIAGSLSSVIALTISSKLTARSTQQDYLLFADIPRRGVDKSVTRLETGGWLYRGIGAGSYVNDSLAVALASTHPRFCAVSRNGRAFRLEPVNDAIWVEQGGAMGDPLGDGQGNDRSAFQAAVDYARAIGVSKIGLAGRSYAIWHSSRISAPSVLAPDGHGLVIAADQRVHLFGAGSQPARILFCNSEGRSFAGDEPGYDYQVIDGEIWRGSGFFIWTHLDQVNPKRSGIVLENLWIDAGARRNVVDGTPQSLAWDITHKGIFIVPDRLGGDVSIINSTLTGWRGETCYCSNDPLAFLYVRNATITDSNGQGLNPNGCRVDVDQCVISNCYLGIEGWTGSAGGRILRTRIVDCRGKNGSGGAFALQGGKYGRSERSTYFAPTEVVWGEAPIGTIDITCERSGKSLVGWWISGRLNLVDSALILGEPAAFNDGTQKTNLEISLSNSALGGSFVIIAGGAGMAGDKLTDNCGISMGVNDASGYSGPRHPPVMWYGSLGDKISIDIRNASSRPAPTAIAATPDFAPSIRYL